MPPNLAVTILLVRSLVLELERRAIAPSMFLESVGFDASRLRTTTAMVDLREWHALLGRAVELTRDRSIGLSMGSRLHGDPVPILPQLAVSCGTLREAVHMLQRYSALLDNVSTFELLEEGQLAYLVHEIFVPVPDLPQFAAELTMTQLYRTSQNFVWGPEEGVLEIWFTHPPPTYLPLYGTIFQRPVRFNKPRTALLIQRDLLDRPQPLANLAMLKMYQSMADALLRSRPALDLPEHVRALLSHDPHERDARRIARALNVAPSFLKRELAAAESPLSALKQQTVHHLARELLVTPGLSIKQISSNLGFSEPSAFHRAFKRWTGITPRAFKEAANAELSTDDELERDGDERE